MCGFDKDVDGYPDKGLNCSEESCKGVRQPNVDIYIYIYRLTYFFYESGLFYGSVNSLL